jgi:hypothetical protein
MIEAQGLAMHHDPHPGCKIGPKGKTLESETRLRLILDRTFGKKRTTPGTGTRRGTGGTIGLSKRLGYRLSKHRGLRRKKKTPCDQKIQNES